MGFFDALGKLGKAAVGAVMLPVDVVRDIADVAMIDDDENEGHTEKRIGKIGSNIVDAVDEIDE